jgi:hypothetical protein
VASDQVKGFLKESADTNTLKEASAATTYPLWFHSRVKERKKNLLANLKFTLCRQRSVKKKIVRGTMGEKRLKLIIKSVQGWSWSSVVQHSPSVCEALSLIPRTEK